MTSSEQSDTKTLPQCSAHIRDVNVKVLIVAINMAEIHFCVPIQEVSVLPEPRPVCSQTGEAGNSICFYLIYNVERQAEGCLDLMFTSLHCTATAQGNS